MVRDNGYLFASFACVGLANYLLNIAAARHFAPGTYSQFGIVLNLLAAFAPISSSVLGAVTRHASIDHLAGDLTPTAAMQRALLRHLSGLYLVALALIFLFHTSLGHVLRLTTITPLYFVAVTAFCLFLQALFQGVLQAEGRYARVGVIYVGEALFRGVVGVAAILAGVGMVGVVAIYTASAALAVWYFPRPQALWTGSRAARQTLGPVYRDIGKLALANLCMIILINLDVIVCRRYLAPEIADQYVAISSMAKFFLFATASVAVIAFAEFIKAIHQGRSMMRPFGLSFGLVTVLGGCFIGVSFVLGPTLLRVTFGDAYRASGHVLWITALNAVMISLINMEVAYFNARNKRWHLVFLLLYGPAMLGVIAFANFHLARYAGLYAAGMTALMLILLLPILADAAMRKPISVDSARIAAMRE